MPFLEANGLTFHTQTLGSGQPVVMIHGMFFGNLAAWYFHTAPELAKHHEVFMYDTRGHGKSTRPETGYDLATMTSDLNALVESYGNTPLDIVGHSYGALTALRFALDQPQRVRRLALIELPLPPHRLAETEDLLPFTNAQMKEIFQADELRSRLSQREDSEEILDSLPESVRGSLLHGKRGIQRIARNLRYLLSDSSLIPDLRAEKDIPDEELAELSCPVLCIYGDESKLRGVGDRLERVLPNPTLIELKGGHYLLNERAPEVTAALDDFLKD